MFLSLSSFKNTFVRPDKSNLIDVVPLCARTVIFFCDDFTFYHYSLVENKILYQSKLPGRPVQAAAISGHQILCLVNELRSLIVLNIEEKSLDHICKLPQTKIINESKQKELFTQMKIIVFERSNKFYIEQPHVDENKRKIYFHNRGSQKRSMKAEQFLIKQFNVRNKILKKLDQQSRVVIFNQIIEENGHFKFTTVDLAKDFLEIQHNCRHESFNRTHVVKQIICISDLQKENQQNSRVLIFLNSQPPEILVFQNQDIYQFPYKGKKKIFLSTILTNVKFGYAILKFMPEPEAETAHENVIELVNLMSGQVINRKQITINYDVKSWQDDFVLLYKKETKASFMSPFQVENIICKKAFYMKMLLEKGFGEVSESFISLVLNGLQ